MNSNKHGVRFVVVGEKISKILVKVGGRKPGEFIDKKYQNL